MEKIDLIFFSLLQFFAMTEWHTLHSVTQAKEWLMIQWRSNTFPNTDAVSDRLNLLPQNGWTKSWLWRPYELPVQGQPPLLPLSPKYKLKENLAVGSFTSSLLYSFALSFVCSWNNLWILFYVAGFSWSHSIVGLCLYFSSMSVRPRELVFPFPWINKCFPLTKSGNIWPS